VGSTSSTIDVGDDVDSGPPGALLVGPVASTTEVGEDIDGGPPEGRCRRVRQRPPTRLKMTSMAGPLGVLPAGLVASTTEVEDDVDGRPPGAAVGGSDSVHH
jgi:hypothetical protein